MNIDEEIFLFLFGVEKSWGEILIIGFFYNKIRRGNMEMCDICFSNFSFTQFLSDASMIHGLYLPARTSSEHRQWTQHSHWQSVGPRHCTLFSMTNGNKSQPEIQKYNFTSFTKKWVYYVSI